MRQPQRRVARLRDLRDAPLDLLPRGVEILQHRLAAAHRHGHDHAECGENRRQDSSKWGVHQHGKWAVVADGSTGGGLAQTIFRNCGGARSFHTCASAPPDSLTLRFRAPRAFGRGADPKPSPLFHGQYDPRRRPMGRRRQRQDHRRAHREGGHRRALAGRQQRRPHRLRRREEIRPAPHSRAAFCARARCASSATAW